VPGGVVYGSNQKRGAIAAAACEECCRNEPRTANGALVRTSGLPGRVGCTIDTESRYQPGATGAASVTFTRLPADARPERASVGEASGSRTSRAR
jgi:hypothetical protein